MPVTISNWLRDAAESLALGGIPSALLDAEIILAHTLRQSRTWLHAHDKDIVEPRKLEIADARLELRKERVPVAYIIGHKEFYGRQFHVNPSVLIPRPESEELIEQLKQCVGATDSSLLDVGTGSGCLGITAKLEFPNLRVTLSDSSPHALKVARENAEELGADVACIHSDLLEHIAERFDIIIANLPYVDRDWERSPETDHEPAEALFAGDAGMALIKKLISEAPGSLTPSGKLLLEADPEQHQAIISFALNHGFAHKTTRGYAMSFMKLPQA
jgi:release factor glutamine methyltransferase